MHTMPATQTVLDLDLDAGSPTVGSTWVDGPLAAFDLETTGVDPHTARILEVALYLDVPGEPIRRLIDTLVDPGPEVVVPAGAAEVHGITRDRLTSERAPAAAEVLPAVHEQLLALAAAGTPVVIYNACYDWPLVTAELRRLRPALALERCQLIDPLVLDRHCDRYRTGRRTLGAACRVYGVTLGDAHRAGADCTAAVAVARAIGRRYPQVGALSGADLQLLQVQAHRTWRASIDAHLLRLGAARPTAVSRWPG
jgi:DNA polymerase III subunit epsilon